MTQRELFIKELGPFAGPLWDPHVLLGDALELMKALQAKKGGQFQLSCNFQRTWDCVFMWGTSSKAYTWGINPQEVICDCVEQVLKSTIEERMKRK